MLTLIGLASFAAPAWWAMVWTANESRSWNQPAV